MDAGQVAGAALDVFQTEPAKDSPLFGTPNFICTPHLGASTTEAQVNVALQVAEQMADFLVNGGVTNALNMPSLSAEEAPKLKPYMALAEKLGSLVGQLTTGVIPRISIPTEGAAAKSDPPAAPVIELARVMVTARGTPAADAVEMLGCLARAATPADRQILDQLRRGPASPLRDRANELVAASDRPKPP